MSCIICKRQVISTTQKTCFSLNVNNFEFHTIIYDLYSINNDVFPILHSNSTVECRHLTF